MVENWMTFFMRATRSGFSRLWDERGSSLTQILRFGPLLWPVVCMTSLECTGTFECSTLILQCTLSTVHLAQYMLLQYRFIAEAIFDLMCLLTPCNTSWFHWVFLTCTISWAGTQMSQAIETISLSFSFFPLLRSPTPARTPFFWPLAHPLDPFVYHPGCAMPRMFPFPGYLLLYIGFWDIV